MIEQTRCLRRRTDCQHIALLILFPSNGRDEEKMREMQASERTTSIQCTNHRIPSYNMYSLFLSRLADFSPLGSGVDTDNVRPFNSLPLPSSKACFASSSANLTNANPLILPVSRSTGMYTSRTVPHRPKCVLRSSLVVSNAMFDT